MKPDVMALQARVAALIVERDAARSEAAIYEGQYLEAKLQRDRLAALVGTYREALEYYARSPNANRTRAETVPMIDYTEDTAVARAALAAGKGSEPAKETT